MGNSEGSKLLFNGQVEIQQHVVDISKLRNPVKLSCSNLAKILGITACDRNKKLIISVSEHSPLKPVVRELFFYESGKRLNIEGAQFYVGSVSLDRKILYCFERC